MARAKLGAPKPRGKGGKKEEKDNTEGLSEGPVKKTKMSEQDIIQKVLKSYDWRVRPYGMNESAGGKQTSADCKKGD